MRINDLFQVSMIAHRHYTNSIAAMGQAALRLSTGYRINSAADDAAGLAISEKMRSQIRGLNMAARNVMDAKSMVQTAEGELGSINDILKRMKELAVQGATETLDDFDRQQIKKEFEQLKREINDIASQGNFNNLPLFDNGSNASLDTLGINVSKGQAQNSDGTSKDVTFVEMNPFRFIDGDILNFKITDKDGNVTEKSYMYTEGDVMGDIVEKLGLDPSTVKRSGNTLAIDGDVEVSFRPSPDRSTDDSITYMIQTGALQGQQLAINIPVVNTRALGLDGITLDDVDSAGRAITAVDKALEKVIDGRTTLGAMSNRLDYKYNNLKNQALNLSEAESRIRDADIAEEMTNFLKAQIQSQLAQWVMAQMNAQASRILDLLR